MTTRGNIPHVDIVVAFCIAAILGYAVFSGYVVFWAKDATMMGDVVGTWKSFAVAAFMFWIGSSSGGKAKDDKPAGTKDDPLAVEGADKNGKPVTVQETKK